ncbi:MAG: hypothetical protein AAF547_11020 [Actinomycetota bacterium]
MVLVACGGDSAGESAEVAFVDDSGGSAPADTTDDVEGAGASSGQGEDDRVDRDATESVDSVDVAPDTAAVAPDGPTGSSDDDQGGSTSRLMTEAAAAVTIGPCRSAAIGLEMTVVPDGWACRVLADDGTGLAGFTLFQPEAGGGIEITISTVSPFGSVCDAMVACDRAEPIDLGADFEMATFDAGGVPFIYGTHVTIAADVAVTTPGPLNDEATAFVVAVLDGVRPFQRN